MTDEELKLYLAQKLPGLIKLNGCMITTIHGSSMCHAWIDTSGPVTEREWEWIIRQVVGLLDPSDYRRYINTLRVRTGGLRNAQFMSWQTKARTLFDVEKTKGTK